MAVYRDTARGDAKDWSERVRQLTGQLDDRKQAAVMLQADNQRLKRAVYDLQKRLGDLEAGRPTQRGEHNALGALRWAVLDAQQQHAETAGNFDAVIAKNRELVDKFNDLTLRFEGAGQDAELARGQLGECEAALALTQEDANQLMEEKEALQQACWDMQQQMDHTIATRAVSEQAAAQLQATLERTGKEGDAQRAAALDAQAAAMAQAHGQELQGRETQLAHAVGRLGQLQALAEDAPPAGWVVVEGSLLPPTHLSEALPVPAKANAAASSVSRSAQPSGSAGGTGTSRPATPSGAPGGTSRPGTPSGSAAGGGGGMGRAQGLAGAAGGTSRPGTPSGGSAGGTSRPGTPAAAASPANGRAASTGGTAELRGDNSLEVIVFDASLTIAAAGSGAWTLLMVRLPGRLPRPLPLGLDAASPTLLLRTLYRLFFPTNVAALAALHGGRLHLSAHRGDLAIVGAFLCSMGAQGSPGEVQQVIAIAAEHSPGCLGLLLFVTDQHGAPGEPLLELSADWRGVVPQGQGAAVPAADEFAVDLGAVHPLQLESCRQSGLFNVSGRAFGGPDGRMYQMWQLVDPFKRQKATMRNSHLPSLQVSEHPVEGARALASGGAALVSALSAPSTTRRQLQVAHSIARGGGGGGTDTGRRGSSGGPSSSRAGRGSTGGGGGGGGAAPEAQVYDPLDGSSTLSIQLVDSTSGAPAGTVRLGLRLHHELDVLPLLPALLQAVAAPPPQAPQVPFPALAAALPNGATPRSSLTAAAAPEAAAAAHPPPPPASAAAPLSARSSANGPAGQGAAGGGGAANGTPRGSKDRPVSRLPSFPQSPALSRSPSLGAAAAAAAAAAASPGSPRGPSAIPMPPSPSSAPTPSLLRQLSAAQRGAAPLPPGPPSAAALAAAAAAAQPPTNWGNASSSSGASWEAGVSRAPPPGALGGRGDFDDNNSEAGSMMSARSSLATAPPLRARR